MALAERFSNLPEYAFTRLRALLDGHAPGGTPLSMSIGEPMHPFPHWVGPLIAERQAEFGRYPPNEGTPELRAAIADWAMRRYGVAVDPETRILPLNGSREGLFSACLALCPETKRGARPLVMMPNPFYQVYAGGAAAAGAEPVYLPATAGTGFLPDLDAIAPAALDRTSIFWLCSPANPQGAVAPLDYLARLLELAERHDFRVFADECYSEIYRDAPPPGMLQALAATGTDPERLVVFNSLSKRSNLPGLRSGFAIAGPESMAALRRLRAYAGAPLPLPLQRVAERAWADEAHVAANRALYAAKYALADRVFSGVPGCASPSAGFFLWLPVPDGEAAALRLWQETGVRVLPGAYLGRDAGQGNPGQGYIRVALVAAPDEMRRGLEAIRRSLFD